MNRTTGPSISWETEQAFSPHFFTSASPRDREGRGLMSSLPSTSYPSSAVNTCFTGLSNSFIRGSSLFLPPLREEVSLELPPLDFLFDRLPLFQIGTPNELPCVQVGWLDDDPDSAILGSPASSAASSSSSSSPFENNEKPYDGKGLYASPQILQQVENSSSTTYGCPMCDDFVDDAEQLHVQNPSEAIQVERKITHDDGSIWVGKTVGDRPWKGKGSWRLPDGGPVVTGEWYQGKLKGRCKISYPDGKSWEGVCKKGKPYNGQGTWRLPDGTEIVGVWNRGGFHRQSTTEQTTGQPVQSSSSSDANTVNFTTRLRPLGVLTDNNLLKEVTFNHSDGTKWFGSVCDDLPWIGKGTWKFPNGVVVTGEWGNGIFIDKFNLSYDRWTWKYEIWTTNFWAGYVKMKRSDGVFQFTQCQHGLLHGESKSENPDGSTWEGEYKYGKIWEGEGCLWWGGGYIIDGEWIEGKLHGPCCITNPDKTTWKGEFCDGFPYEGSGTDSFSRNIMISGKWENGGLSGHCVIRYPDGAKWEGTCKDGKPYDGQGTQKKSDGTIIEGKWKEGELDGDCIIRSPEGRESHCRYVNRMIQREI